MDSVAELPRRVRTKARVVGLGELDLPSLDAVEQRRLQLRIAWATVLIGVCTSVVLTSLWDHNQMPAQRVTLIRIGVLALAAAFSIYALDREVSLRHISHLLVEERVVTAALINRVRELELILDATKEMSTALGSQQVPDVIMRAACELFGAAEAAVVMVEEDDALRAVTVNTREDAPDAVFVAGEEVISAVEESREPTLFDWREDDGSVRSAICVPLERGDQFIGVLNVIASPERSFNGYDLRALNLFAGHAAGALARARAYDTQRARVTELLELDRERSEFVASVSHDLRTPLTSILGAAVTGQRDGMSSDQHREMFESVERNARRLSSMVDDLLRAAELDSAAPRQAPVPIDAAEVAHIAATDLARAGRAFEVNAPKPCPMTAPPGALERIVENLVTNAFVHGAAPVEVSVTSSSTRMLLCVMDSDPGIPAEHRSRVLEPFCRVDKSRSRPGLGLGLAVVKRLVEEGGGRVWVEDGPLGGAAILISLPVAWAEPA